MKLALTIILISAAAFALLSVIAGLVLYLLGVRRGRETPVEEGSYGPYSERVLSGARWLDAQDMERLTMKSFDGLELVGYFLPAEGAPRGAMLLMHGYRSTFKVDFSCSAKLLHELGFDLLLVYQRACGESGGKNICFGIKERFDCRGWARLLAAREPEGTPIFLYGLSLGCATVLMATGLELPETVRGIVADCGYTSPHAIWKHVANNNLHIAYGVRGVIASEILRHKIQVGSNDFSTTEALKNTRIPVLLIHGTGDHFVPVEMTYENYLACGGPRRLLIVPGADHGMSYFTDPERYTAAVLAFWKDFDSWEGRNQA